MAGGIDLTGFDHALRIVTARDGEQIGSAGATMDSTPLLEQRQWLGRVRAGGLDFLLMIGLATALIKARKEHVEDWVAVLVANHLFGATDALVSAMLWDLPAEVALSGGRRSTNVGFRLRF